MVEVVEVVRVVGAVGVFRVVEVRKVSQVGGAVDLVRFGLEGSKSSTMIESVSQ